VRRQRPLGGGEGEGGAGRGLGACGGIEGETGGGRGGREASDDLRSGEGLCVVVEVESAPAAAATAAAVLEGDSSGAEGGT